MPAAALPILVNIFVAGMFVASFLTIAQLNPGFGHIRWFALSYAIGMLTPLSEFVLPLSPSPTPFMITSFAGLFGGIVLMAPAISRLHGRRPAWWIGGVIFISGLCLRGLVWGGERNEFWYELTYQIPFACASWFCAATSYLHGRKTPLDRAATALFTVIGAHFLLKPFAAVRFGSGATASDYVGTTYATVSQASSGILLIAAGLLVLIDALQTVVLRDRREAISDPLTGLPNRRGLHASFEDMARRHRSIPAAIAIIDIDHFKRINDTWGHQKGDDVIRAVALCLEENCPALSTVARIGGEEFVLLFPWEGPALAQLACENIRMAVAQLEFKRVETVTVSIGLTPVAAHEDLSSAMKRADGGLYKAKQSGRNTSVLEPNETVDIPSDRDLQVAK
ncbi:GGDEF domain-containing protein [Rhizobium sp. CG5]|uniref:GGDEF domain-containing protein n=1 Tax=Rhizobium sp. CG5 TaxID=2726076 RepID=UPI0020344AD4|nr:GGDEF domain-containing protein [Rhizobium sp. CG5]MCM2474500.1 GGDEF domain-containing protein [Rhizobium sp. CG5]